MTFPFPLAPLVLQHKIDTTGLPRFGDMTQGGGLNAAFDGNISQDTSNCAVGVNDSSTAFAGVDLGSGAARVLTGFRAFPTTNQGYYQGGGANSVTVSLFGSNAQPVSATNGTLLGSASGTNSNSLVLSNFAVANTTAFRFVWCVVSANPIAGKSFTAEFEFYATP